MHEFGNLSPINGINGEMLFARARLRGELDRRLDGKIWKSSDILVAEDTILPNFGPAKKVRVILPDLGPFAGLPRAAISYAHSSTRSRYEQIGADVSQAAGQLIAETVDEERHYAYVLVQDLSTRPIKLRAGTGLFRLYAEPFPSLERGNVSLEGRKLLDAIRRRKIQISGKRGVDWGVAYDHQTLQVGLLLENVEEYERVWKTPFPHADKAKFLYKGSEAAFGIWLRLDPNKKMWIPPHSKNAPIYIPGGSGIDYRAKIDKYLKPAPESGDPIHWIGETVSRVKLGPKVDALIERNPLSDIANINRDYMHTNSLLIDRGFGWRIRTEIYGKVVAGESTYILLRFLRDLK